MIHAAIRQHAPMVLAATLTCIALGSVYRLDLPEPASAALQDTQSDAQRQAAERRAWIQEVRAQCSAIHGAQAYVFETPDGDLACRRRAAPDA